MDDVYVLSISDDGSDGKFFRGFGRTSRPKVSSDFMRAAALSGDAHTGVVSRSVSLGWHVRVWLITPFVVAEFPEAAPEAAPIGLSKDSY